MNHFTHYMKQEMTPPILLKPQVVIVNDDKTQINVLSGLLKKEGIHVLAFHDASDALTEMERRPPPDLIITDLYMPNIDGWQLCRLLRSPEYLKLNPVPILIISATFSGADIVDISADLGANAFLPSPVNGKEFLKLVHALLNGEMPSRHLQALIIDDSVTLCSLLSRSFTAHGYQVQTARTCLEAIEIFENTPFDVAIIDYHLPDGHGDTLLTIFRHRKPDCDCIMITTDPNPRLALSWMKQGAAAYLHKPFTPEYLIEMCAKARRERSLLRVETLLDQRTRELRKSEERFRTIVRNAFDMIALIGTDGQFLYCNRAYTDILGYQQDALVNHTCFDIVHPEDRPTAMKLFEKGLIDNFSSDSIQLRLIHADGRFLHVDHQARLIFDSNDTPLVLLNSRDMTRQQQAEELLKKKSNERRMLLDTIPTQIWYLSDVDTYGAVNRAYADFVGRSPKDIAYRKLTDVLPPENIGRCRESNLLVFNTGRAVSAEEWMLNAAGERRLIHITKTPKLDEHGRIEFVVCAGNDLTEVRSFERQFGTIFDKAPVGIEIYDAEGKLRAANPKCIELFGIEDEKEIAGFNLFDDPNVTDNVKAQLLRGETVYFESPFDFEIVRTARLYRTSRSGIIHLAVLISQLKPADKLDFSGFLAIVQDITQQKQYEVDRLNYERRLQQLQKAESLGRMAGAIAHNFNNQLQAVIGNLEMAVDEVPQQSRHLMEALKAAQKAADVSGMMLAYRGQIPGRQTWIDLSEACRRSLPMIRAAAPQQVVIEADLPESGPIVHASSGQIHQAITNLIVNACEATGDHPNDIVLSVATVSSDQIPAIRRVPIDWTPENIDYACLEVRDTGSGIADKDIDKIFDPFFSTRFYGRGMGLSVVLGIVGAHAGCVVVESERDRGSTFRVYLPISPEGPPSRPMQTMPASAPEVTGTVLLIDDEEPVRRLTATMLSRLGLTVMETDNGIDALELFKMHHNDIHFIFSDMTMPGMNGWELLDTVRAISPKIPVILSSGYDEGYLLADEHPEQPDVFLGKPYRFQELRHAVHQVMLNR